MLQRLLLSLLAILILSACSTTKNQHGVTIKKKIDYNPINQIKNLF
tara:strand:+ start:2101 stop:2238 length:138 start_codon:yes stop_codon:yes gene_type:complete